MHNMAVVVAPFDRWTLRDIAQRSVLYLLRWCSAMSFPRIFLVAVSMFCVVGCSSVKTYDGPSKPRGEIAFLKKSPDSPAVINNIDGKFRGIGNLDSHEFLPGPHVLKIHFVSAVAGTMYYSTDPVILSFNAAPGATYQLEARADSTMKKWIAWIKEEASGSVVSRIVPAAQ